MLAYEVFLIKIMVCQPICHFSKQLKNADMYTVQAMSRAIVAPGLSRVLP